MSSRHQKYVAMIGDKDLSLFDKVEAWVSTLDMFAHQTYAKTAVVQDCEPGWLRCTYVLIDSMRSLC
jgi:hypothetical protein